MRGGERRLYVYAFADAGLPPRVQVRGRRLRTLAPASIAVIGEARAPAAPARAALLEHHEVVVALAARCPALLPARFGTTASEASLCEFVRTHHDTLAAALELVRGCTQMTIRVAGPPDTGRPVEERRGGGAAYLQSRRRRLEYLPPEIGPIRALFSSLASAERAEAGEGRLRLSVFHLLPAERLAEYRKRAASLQSQLLPLQVAVSGPWPPFAFAPELI